MHKIIIAYPLYTYLNWSNSAQAYTTAYPWLIQPNDQIVDAKSQAILTAFEKKRYDKK